MPKSLIAYMIAVSIAVHALVVLALRHALDIAPALTILALASGLAIALALAAIWPMRPAIACTLASIGAITGIARAPVELPPLAAPMSLSGVVIDVVREDPATRVLLAEVEAKTKTKTYAIDRLAVRFDYLDVDADPILGTTIAFEGELGRPRVALNPTTTPRELAPLFASAYTSPTLDDRAPSWSTTTALSLRARLTFPSASATALYRALILGDRTELDADTRYAYQDTGTAHLLAISGMNLALLGWGLFQLLVFMLVRATRIPGVRRAGFEWLAQGHRPRVLAAVVALAMTTAYTSLIAPSDATDRALAALAITFIGIVLLRPTTTWRTLAVCFFAAALFDPEALLHAGFLLSFAATASLVVVAPHLRVINNYLKPFRYRRSAQFLATLIIADLACFLATVPLTITWFGQLPSHSLWVNLIAIPFMTLAVFPAAVIWVIVASAIPPLGDLTAPALTWLGDAFNNFIRVAGEVAGPSSTESWPWLIGVIATLAWLAIMTLRRTPFRLGALALAVTTLAAFAYEHQPAGLQLIALDVGHGDAIALGLPDGTRVLIDTGGTRQESSLRDPNRMLAERTLVPALRAIGWSSIDLLIFSHSHSDHTGAALALSDRIPIRDVWMPPCTRHPLRRLVAHLEQRGARIHEVPRGPPFDYGGAHFELLSPAPDTEREDGCSVAANDTSLVVRVSYAGQRILLTGDIEAPTEAALLASVPADLRADVLKVPHHGSRTSSTDAFLDAVAPRLAIVSGLPGERPPPHPAIMERYAAHHIPTRVTGTDGAVTIHVDPSGLMTVKPP